MSGKVWQRGTVQRILAVRLIALLLVRHGCWDHQAGAHRPATTVSTEQQQVRFAGPWGVPSKQRIAPATTTSQVDDTCQPGRTNAPATAPAVVTRRSAFLPLLLISRHPGRLSNLPSPGRVTSHLHGRLSSQQGHSTLLFSKAERRTKVLLCEPNSMNVDSPLAPSLQPSSTSPPSRL